MFSRHLHDASWESLYSSRVWESSAIKKFFHRRSGMKKKTASTNKTVKTSWEKLWSAKNDGGERTEWTPVWTKKQKAKTANLSRVENAFWVQHKQRQQHEFGISLSVISIKIKVGLRDDWAFARDLITQERLCFTLCGTSLTRSRSLAFFINVKQEGCEKKPANGFDGFTRLFTARRWLPLMLRVWCAHFIADFFSSCSSNVNVYRSYVGEFRERLAATTPNDKTFVSLCAEIYFPRCNSLNVLIFMAYALGSSAKFCT